jgi:hypothetical protein
VAKRSPILGYNHNFRHRGLVFHVQTEDSGIENPHIFTHLFNGGVILATRKLTYDIGSATEVVKALMQAQHKAMLKDLKRGTFDEKIDRYFGDRPELRPARSRDTLRENAAALHGIEELGLEDIEILEPEEPSIRDTLREPPMSRTPETIHVQTTERIARRPAARGVKKPRKPTPEVVVSRPSVIVGSPPRTVAGKPPSRARQVREGSSSLFGKDLISEKSLDEVILAYLSEDGGPERGG